MALTTYVPYLSVLFILFQITDCFQWSQVQESSHVISPYLGSTTTLPCDFSLSDLETQQMKQFHVVLWSRQTNSPAPQNWQALATITNINNVLDSSPKIIFSDQNKFSMRNNSLVVFNVGIDDEGQYQCEVKSSFYTTPSVVMLNVQYKPVETQLLASKTTVTINKEGFELNCTAHANPKAGYSFFLNGKLIQNSTSHRYVIDKANKQNSGEYTCIPWNYYGDGPNATISIKVGLEKTIVEQSMSDEVIAGITGAVALAVIIVVVIAIICKRLRDDKKPEPAKSTASLSPSDATEAHIGPGIYGSEYSINSGVQNIYTGSSSPKVYKLNGSQDVLPDTNM